jgi:hypothetical protein
MPIKKYDIDPADLDDNGIAENQTTAGAASLTLDGALCDLGTAGQFDIGDAYSAGIGGIQLVFDAAGDISTVVFTITGLDQDGDSQTETVTGVTTSPVTTTKYWSQVTDIASDAAVGSNVFVGTVTGGLVSRTIPVNKHSDSGPTLAVVNLTGTCQYDLQETFDDVETVASPDMLWTDVSSNQSSDLTASASAGCRAVRLKFDSYSNGAELQFYVSYPAFR